MNLEQMKARLSEIVNKLAEFAAIENYSTEDVDTINALNDEFEGLKKNIEAKEKVMAMTAAASASTRKTTPETTRVVVEASRSEKNGGFKSFGEFLNAVKKSSTTSEVDKRFQNTMSEGVNADGGFAVPEEFGSDINTALLQSDESLFAKTKQLKVSSNNLTIPKSETQPWSGGIQAYWTNENAAITDSKAVLSQASFKLNKLAALVKITDELLEDGLALESYIKMMAPLAIVHKVNEAIISGDGVGKPAGLLGSTFGVTVLKEVGQAADTIVAKNVIKMYSKMIPSARKGAVWYVNAMCEEQLRTMKDDNGNFIYLAAGSQLNQSPYALLLGLPVVPLMGGLPALGDKGDIVLVNLDYYYTIAKGGVKTAVSSHLFFDRDVQAFKFTLRLDGKCPFVSPVTTQFGAHTMSAIVTLEDRI
jgi:HK97 family phage major capsid protein